MNPCEVTVYVQEKKKQNVKLENAIITQSKHSLKMRVKILIFHENWNVDENFLKNSMNSITTFT